MEYIRKNEEAVSPVIGVILMVVITVIIAAVLAVFAFGVGAPSKGPQASLKVVAVDATLDTVTVQHYGGDAVRLVDTKIIVDQIDDTGAIIGTAVYDSAGIATDGELTAGDKLEIGVNADSMTKNGAITTYGTTSRSGTTDLAAGVGNSVAVTVIHIPSGNVLSKPIAKI